MNRSFLKKLLLINSPYNLETLLQIRMDILENMQEKKFSYYLQQMNQLSQQINTVMNNKELLLDDNYWFNHGQGQSYWQNESPDLYAKYKSEKLKRLNMFEPSGLTSMANLILTDENIDNLIGKAVWMTEQQIIFLKTLISLYFKTNMRLWPVHLNMDLTFSQMQTEIKTRLSQNSSANSTADLSLENSTKHEVLSMIKNLCKSMLSGSGPFVLKILQQINTANESALSKNIKVSDITADIFSNIPGLTNEERIYVVDHLEVESSLKEKMTPETLGSASIAETHITYSDEYAQQVIMKFVKPMYAYYFLCEVNFLLTDVWKQLPVSMNGKSKYILQCRKLLMFFIREFIKEFDYQGEFNNTVIGYEVYNQTHGKIKSIIAMQVVIDPFPVLILEYVKGIPLDTVVNANQLSKDEIVDLYKRVYELMEEWMKKTLWGKSGFFHSDLHPGNIMFTENRDLYLIDYGSCGILTAKHQCLLLSAMLTSGNIKNIKYSELSTPKNQKIHRTNVIMSRRFVKIIWELCDLSNHDPRHLEEVADKILNYKQQWGIYFAGLFLDVIRHSDDIGSCTNSPNLLFGRGVAYLGNMLNLLVKKCGNLKTCPHLSAGKMVAKNLIAHPQQLINVIQKGRVC